MRKLFLDPGRHAEWRALIQSGDPTALAMLSHMRKLAGNPDEGDLQGPDSLKGAIDSALCRISLAWIDQDADAANTGREEVLSCLPQFHASDLGKAARSLSAVLAWEFGSELWTEDDRKVFADTIRDIALSFLEIGKGNPHSVTNNWWMLTHGGCLLACLAVDGEEGTQGVIDLAELKAWAYGRYKAFCGQFGDAGLYHEGSGYTAYTLSMLIPVAYAVDRHLDPRFLEAFPQLRRSLASLLVGTAALEHRENGSGDPVFGASLQWNDAGRGCLGLNPFLPGMAIAPVEWQGALRTVFDRLLGIDGRREWTCPFRGFPLLVALYPFSVTKADPNGVLPKWVHDQRQGLGLWRSAWADGSESVLGWYARSVHPGGHSQDDAASIRLIANGRTWICGGGQARAKAEWQSVFTQARETDRPDPSPLAHVTFCEQQETGGLVAMDTRKSMGAYGERYISWNTGLGKPICLAILDLLDEHRDPPLDWQWNLSFPRELEGTLHADGGGFTLVDPGKGSLTGRFLIDAPDELGIAEMPGSSRTFSNGRKVDYPGDRFVHGVFKQVRRGRILVVMAVDHPGKESGISFREGAVYLDGTPWLRPFSPAILSGTDLRRAVPNFMKHPGG